MLPAFATIDQLEVRLSSPVDVTREQAALDDASAEIRAEARKNWTTTNDDDEVVLDLPTGDDAWRADIVVQVCLAAAKRALENPEGVTREEIGTYAVGYSSASPDVYLTAGERRQIRRAAGISGLWTQPVDRGDCLETASVGASCGPETFLAVEPAGEPIPWA